MRVDQFRVARDPALPLDFRSETPEGDGSKMIRGWELTHNLTKIAVEIHPQTSPALNEYNKVLMLVYAVCKKSRRTS